MGIFEKEHMKTLFELYFVHLYTSDLFSHFKL